MSLTDKQVSNFWSKVSKTATCWNWTACKANGYGRVMVLGRPHLAHRVSWFIEHGAWPAGVLMHVCDNQECVNPAHLRDATQAENIADMCAKGRSKPSPTQWLSDERVREIRSLASMGRSHALIGRLLALPYLQVRKVALRKTYKDIA